MLRYWIQTNYKIKISRTAVIKYFQNLPEMQGEVEATAAEPEPVEYENAPVAEEYDTGLWVDNVALGLIEAGNNFVLWCQLSESDSFNYFPLSISADEAKQMLEDLIKQLKDQNLTSQEQVSDIAYQVVFEKHQAEDRLVDLSPKELETVERMVGFFFSEHRK